MNVYDFDKTIYKKDSSVQFYLYAIKGHPLVFVRSIFCQIGGIIQYKLGRISKERMKEKYFVFFKYIDAEKLADDFVEKEFKNINSWYVDKKCPDDVIISASPEFIVRRFMWKLGVNNVIASDVSSVDGKFTGANCHGKEKLRRFELNYGDSRIDEFYSDSYSDLPLAQKAERAFLVKKDGFAKFDK